MQKPITAGEITPVRVVIVTLDSHLASAARRAHDALRAELPGLSLTLHAAAEWGQDNAALERCKADIATGDVIIANMLFMEEHIRAVLPALAARRNDCDAMIGCLSAGEVIRLTRLGPFTMDGAQKGPMAMLRRLRGNAGKPGGSSGAGQMAMLKRLPKLLRFIPGTAQDLRAYFLTLQYWLSGSDENIASLVRMLVGRYADGPRRGLRGKIATRPPIEYPEIGVYHPQLEGRVASDATRLPCRPDRRGTVGLLLMRSYLLAGNTGHYDGVIAALEARGLAVIPAFACGLDARPAIDKFFRRDGATIIDAMVSLTGFSLVGGPAYNDAKAAEQILTVLDVPYLAAHPVEFQTLDAWESSDRGLTPIESTMMVAIPELDGATGPMVYGGRRGGVPGADGAFGAVRDMQSDTERTKMLAARIERIVALRRSSRAERRIAIVLFNFPPNAGNIGTAAYLSVFESLCNTLGGLAKAGYTVELPRSVDDLRDRIIAGNAQRFGANANVHTRISAGDHVARQRWLGEIEAQWGPAPGRQQSDGSSIFVLGAQFGNVFVGIQPSMGYEGDPMRLLFERGFAPTHAFAAFYRYINEDFRAHAVLHFGTHGALEFMPGKQTGLSGDCWPDRLIGDLPNLYLYAANNPSEGAIAKRRAAATLISYMTPPVATAGLYRGLVELKSSLQRWRQLDPEDSEAYGQLVPLIQAQAVALDLAKAEPAWLDSDQARIVALAETVIELEYTLIPHGLHVVGAPPSAAERTELLLAIAEASHGKRLARAAVEMLIAGTAQPKGITDDDAPDRLDAELARQLCETDRLLATEHELPALIHALDARFVAPAPGGDVLRTPAILPTGRNLHGFDPFRIPSAFAVGDGARQAARLLARYTADGHSFPETIALVLWGTDNLKTEGGPIAQALALLGARPRFDSYGRLAGAVLVPLAELGRPRVDVVVTISGIFRDLLPLQIKLLAEACFLAASADEPLEQNFVRKHALAYQAVNGGDLESAALRVFGNADGAYGSNVNNLVESSRWQDEDELAETYTRRKGFAYGRAGCAQQQPHLLRSVLAGVDVAYQNLDSVELGVTTIDTYFDTLGGISRAVRRERGASAPVYIGDQTRGEGTVRTLGEQVAIETRTRMLNPKWYEGMLKHGYEGVRQIEVHVTNTMGWSATTGEVEPWVYQRLTQTFMLDPQMRERLAALNPTASAKVANRLIEAHERKYWTPDPETLAALRKAGEELEDRLEGIGLEAAA